MRLTDKQHEKLTELMTHALGMCDCGYSDKKCLFNKILDLDDDNAAVVALVVKEIEKI